MTPMTKCTLILSLFPMLFSCSPSREEKAAEIAKSEMIKILYNAGSYEPIETQIDSAFTSIYTDLAIVRVRERADAIVENQFYGWNIYHRFRCANGYGIKKISDILFVVDEDMKIVKGCFSLDKDDDYNLVKLKKTIDKAIEKPEIK